MWLSGQQKRPADEGEGQVGIVTMSEDDTAVLLDCERRGLQVYSPGGYTWTPKVDSKVMVIQGKGEIPCIVGALQGSEEPNEVNINAAKELTLEAEKATAKAEGDVVAEAENIRLMGQVYVKEETLEELIARIVMMILGGLG